MAPGGAAVVIASQSGHRLPASAEENEALTTSRADDLLALPHAPADRVNRSLHAYQLAKRADSLRVMAEAIQLGEERGTGSTPSAPASSSRLWLRTSCQGLAAKAIAA